MATHLYFQFQSNTTWVILVFSPHFSDREEFGPFPINIPIMDQSVPPVCIHFSIVTTNSYTLRGHLSHFSWAPTSRASLPLSVSGSKTPHQAAATVTSYVWHMDTLFTPFRCHRPIPGQYHCLSVWMPSSCHLGSNLQQQATLSNVLLTVTTCVLLCWVTTPSQPCADSSLSCTDHLTDLGLDYFERKKGGKEALHAFLIM